MALRCRLCPQTIQQPLQRVALAQLARVLPFMDDRMVLSGHLNRTVGAIVRYHMHKKRAEG